MKKHRIAVGAAAVAATMAVAATPAIAATVPIQLSFDHLTLVTPATGAQGVVTPTTQPVTATANVDPTSGAFTIDPSTFTVPTYNFTSPVPGSVSLSLANTASGTANFTTGALTMTADILATITVPSLGGACTIDTGPLTLSTATTKPYPGQDFPAGPTGAASGDGAFGVGWTSLPAGTGPSCATIDSLIDNGAGGIWISRGIDPTASSTTTATAPKVAVSVTKPASVKAGKAAKVKVTVKNTGAADTKSVKVCLTAKSPLKASGCQTVTKPAAGASKTLSFTVKTTAATKAGKHVLKITATGLKAKSVAVTVTRAKLAPAA